MASRVSAVTRLDRQIVIVIEVAIRAGGHLACRRHLVRVRQRKTSGRVVKIGRQPGNRIVASGARRNRKHGGRRRMFRVRRLLPRRQMASRIPAVRRCDLQIEVVANMAIQTGNIRVPVREREIDGRCGMVYRSAQPAIKRMARIAGLRELTCYVVRTLGVLKVSHMAGVAGRRQALILTHSRALVAIFALHCRVSTQQRKTILVIFYLLDRDIPALNGVALRAVCSHFSLVNVGVAILAILADVGKDGLAVALHALHFFVHAA